MSALSNSEGQKRSSRARHNQRMVSGDRSTVVAVVRAFAEDKLVIPARELEGSSHLLICQRPTCRTNRTTACGVVINAV